MCSQWDSTKVKDQIISLLVKLRQSKEEKLGNLFYEETKALIPKLVNDISKQENYRTISVINIRVKIINKILANRIQLHIKNTS